MLSTIGYSRSSATLMDNLHYEKCADGTDKCIEDEIPFEVPEGWAWCRLSSVTEAIGDGDHQPPPQAPTGIPFLVISNVSNGELSFENTRYVPKSYYDALPDTRKPRRGDLLFTVTGSYGIPVPVITDESFCFQRHIAIIRPCYITSNYLAVILSTAYIKAICDDKATGTAQKTVGLGTLRDLLIPIAPYEEQDRICSMAEKAIEHVEEIKKGKDDLQQLIEKLKTRILDLAIRGQLVRQNPDDEPASVLLDRIHTEKEELIKQSKIKRDKRESIIFRGDDNSYYEKIGDEIVCIDDELPFAIPDGWTWCELQDCCMKEIKRGRSPKYAETGSVLSFAQKCNQKVGGINIGLALWIDDTSVDRYEATEYLRDNDIVINSTGTGTLGRIGIYHSSDNPNGIPIVPDSHVTVVRTSEHIHPAYIYCSLKAMQTSIESMGEGSTNQKELKPLTVQQLRIPLPPYSEQLEICDRVNAMMTALSMMGTELQR